MGCTQSQQRRWRGCLTSLYDGLNPEDVKHLESAILHREVGDFSASLDIFDTLLAPGLHIPVVALEHSSTFLKQGRLEAADKALQASWLLAQGDPDRLTRPEYRLMKLVRAVLHHWTIGTLTDMLEAIRETRQWLAEVPVDEYTDVQVCLFCQL